MTASLAVKIGSALARQMSGSNVSAVRGVTVAEAAVVAVVEVAELARCVIGWASVVSAVGWVGVVEVVVEVVLEVAGGVDGRLPVGESLESSDRELSDWSVSVDSDRGDMG